MTLLRIISLIIVLFVVGYLFMSEEFEDALFHSIGMGFWLFMFWYADEIGSHIGYCGWHGVSTPTPGWLLRIVMVLIIVIFIIIHIVTST